MDRNARDLWPARVGPGDQRGAGTRCHEPEDRLRRVRAMNRIGTTPASRKALSCSCRALMSSL